MAHLSSVLEHINRHSHVSGIGSSGLSCSAPCQHASTRANLAEGYDEDALPAGDAQAGHSQVVQVLAAQLGGAHVPPARLCEARHPGVLQHLCRARKQRL